MRDIPRKNIHTLKNYGDDSVSNEDRLEFILLLGGLTFLFFSAPVTYAFTDLGYLSIWFVTFGFLDVCLSQVLPKYIVDDGLVKEQDAD